MSRKDNEIINKFLFDFAKELKTEKQIDFVLLFGSAARGEFQIGISDIDLIIQVKNKRDIKRIEKNAEEIFWRLDKKYKTGLRDVCSTGRSDIFSIFEKQVKLYKPFEVIGPKDILWKQGKIDSSALGVFATLAPVNQFAKKVKAEGKVLVGRNVLEEIKIKETLSDKVKAMILPYVLSSFSILVSIVSPEKGLKYAIKAVLYAIDDQLAVMEERTAKTASLNLRILKTELGGYYSIRLAKEALYVKKNFEKVTKEWGFIDKFSFCVQAPPYIAYNNFLSAAHYFLKLCQNIRK
ncbi:nucleotidyltransferase domain-containing protein [Candidatus Micrarchaeota archaeon]|nr:nucleotidyltransferase domain-containing protein [Candidatus Micrarchaeota archaeon]